MGLFMLSNQDIFPVHDKQNKSLDGMKQFASVAGVAVTEISGKDSDRFYKIHSIIYSFGILLFLILFVIQKFTGAITSCLEK